MSTKLKVLIVATMDTKSKETLFLKKCLEAQDVSAIVIDAGIRGESPVQVEITRQQVAAATGKSLGEIQHLKPEGIALNAMVAGATKLVHDLLERKIISGIIGLGGSMGTTLGTGIMRTLPVGFPKVMISTMASRDTRLFVGTKDIMMLHSVCDLAGLNIVTRAVLRNGALALAGMVKGLSGDEFMPAPQQHQLIAISTLGTTEACALRLRQKLEADGKEVVTFHTVGSGGQAMDELIDQGHVEFVLDISLHELVDNMFGGDYDAGHARGRASIRKGISTIFVPGNVDFLVTGPVETAKKQFPGRAYHIHNSAITAVRTSRQELMELARTLAGFCKDAKGPVAFLIPLGGFSAFDSPGETLEDKGARKVFRDALRESLPAGIPIVESEHHINDPEFADKILDIMEGVYNALPSDK
ncbi:MAG: UPF0261 family protein [Deltaproteobacteria bacterium]|nr:MAG: UPF0261 family protein [Deltaproteobacteria bacterium]